MIQSSSSDTNECRDNTSNGCSHGCQNTVGSFQCTCPSRYRLLADRRTCVLSVLRQTLTSPIGIVALPANPSAKISDYIWVIRLPDVSRAVKLTFQSRFDIQDSPSCASSYLEVRDGDDSNSTLVGRYCGSTAPPVVTSSTNTLYIRLYTSPNHTSNVEFRAAFISVQLNLTQTAIHQTLTSPIGTVALPANPSAKISDYIWVIRLPDVSKAIQLTFQSRFDIQDSPSCSSSYLEIRDGDKPASMLVGRYCGSTAPPVITSSTNTLYIRLHILPNHNSNVGFSALYSAIQLPQGKHILRYIYTGSVIIVFQVCLDVQESCLHLHSLVHRISQHSTMDSRKFASLTFSLANL